MKMSKWLVYILLVVLLAGCGSSENSKMYSDKEKQDNSTFSEKDRGGEQPSTPTKKPKPTATASTGVGNQPASIRIRKEAAPAGILEQISWGGQGGGEGLEITEAKLDCENCKAGIKDDTITFTNFEPWQKVEVLIYEGGKSNECNLNAADYVTTLHVQMDENGNFSSDLTGSTNDLLVIRVADADTGKELWLSAFVAFGQMDCSFLTQAKSCPGAPKQRLKVDEMAYVCTAKDSVKLRKGPGKSFSIIKSLVPGAEVMVTDGPKCADNWSWWKVRTESGYTGWMTEGGDNVDPYFLCPKP